MKNVLAPKVSVIIPMYNAEKYIEQCLQSLLNQTLDNIEVIVVDDCSTDNSFALVQKMLPQFKGDKRLIVMKTNQNTGWSCLPRNFGLEQARGKYIAFVDNDDFLEAKALEIFYNVAEKFDAEVVHAERIFLHPEKNGKMTTHIGGIQRSDFVTEPTLEPFDLAARINKFIQHQTHWWVWNRLYRRDFLIEHQIKFPDMQSFEDLIFSFYCLVEAKKFVRIPDLLYHWRTLENSNSHKTLDGVTFVKRLTTVVRFLDNFMLGKEFFISNPSFRYAALDFFVKHRLQVFGDGMFVKLHEDPGKIYALLYDQNFSKNPQENIALTSCLFIDAARYEILIQEQQKQIEELKKQLAKFQS